MNEMLSDEGEQHLESPNPNYLSIPINDEIAYVDNRKSSDQVFDTHDTLIKNTEEVPPIHHNRNQSG